jgi:hypothetical protein
VRELNKPTTIPAKRFSSVGKGNRTPAIHRQKAKARLTVVAISLTPFPSSSSLNQFILRERLPGNIFNDYDLGGYLAFRLGPQYPDYVDGRAIPFLEVMFEQREVMRRAPDSEAWREEADRRGINTLIFWLARSRTSVPLRQFCASQAWKLVYLDDVAAVFVRNRPENAQVLDRLQIDCAKAGFEPPATLIADASYFEAAPSCSISTPTLAPSSTGCPATRKRKSRWIERSRYSRMNRIFFTREAGYMR